MYRTVSPRLGRQCCPWPCAARRFERIANAGCIGLHHSCKRLEVADCALGLRLGKLDEIGYDEIGYVKCRNAFVGKRPKSTYAITAKGRRALGNCLATMQQLIDSMEALE